MIKRLDDQTKRVSWADHAVHTGEIINAYKHSVGKPKGKDYLAELGQIRTAILRLIFNTRGVGA
jgi:hypothetical protein